MANSYKAPKEWGNHWQISRNQTLDKRELPPHTRIVRRIEVGYEINGKKQLMPCMEKTLLNEETGEIIDAVFGSAPACYWFRNQLYGRDFNRPHIAALPDKTEKTYETYWDRLSEVNELIFDKFRWHKESRSAMKEFAIKRGWHSAALKKTRL